jgi:membrane associated rhomboid family serine protease
MAEDSAWDAKTIDRSKSMARIERDMTVGDWARTFYWGNWPAYLVVAACAAVFLAQMAGRFPIETWAFSGKAMDEGRYLTLVTSLFMHGGIAHIFFNMTAYLSTAPIVCARFGKGIGAFIPYTIFYLLCGLAGNGFFWLLHPHGEVPVVGASGAIYGLIAAMYRLNIYEDRLYPLWSRRVWLALRFLLTSNLTIILLFGGPAILVQLVDHKSLQDMVLPIAWEGHVGGFFAGLLLIGLMAGKGWHGDWRAGISLRYLREMSDTVDPESNPGVH